MWLRQSVDIMSAIIIPSCTISEKTNDPTLRKFIVGRTDRQTDRQTGRQADEIDFIGRSSTKVEGPKVVIKTSTLYLKFL